MKSEKGDFERFTHEGNAADAIQMLEKGANPDGIVLPSAGHRGAYSRDFVSVLNKAVEKGMTDDAQKALLENALKTSSIDLILDIAPVLKPEVVQSVMTDDAKKALLNRACKQPQKSLISSINRTFDIPPEMSTAALNTYIENDIRLHSNAFDSVASELVIAGANYQSRPGYEKNDLINHMVQMRDAFENFAKDCGGKIKGMNSELSFSNLAPQDLAVLINAVIAVHPHHSLEQESVNNYKNTHPDQAKFLEEFQEALVAGVLTKIWAAIQSCLPNGIPQEEYVKNAIDTQIKETLSSHKETVQEMMTAKSQDAGMSR